MSRNIRWRLQFKSLKGVGCLVNIYDEDWTSSADETKTGSDVPFAVEQGVTLLTGSKDPFYFEEDDDDDLLRVLRYKTGYINVVELTYGELSDLMPLTNTEHYVEFFYGSTLVFIGYMQAQNFENDWVAAPRELHLPVMSPLGLAAGKTLNVINPPTRVSLATLLHEVCVDLYPKGTGVIMPDVSPSLEGTINSLVVCPANSSFSQSIATASIPYDPITYEEFIEGLCNCFGWMVHDSVNGPVFTKFDHGGNYCSYTFANLPTMTHKQTVAPAGNVKWALGNYSQVADNDGKTSDILPVSKINLNFQGEWKTSASFDFNALRYHSESHYSNNHAAWFTPVDGLLTGDQLRLAGNMFNTANGYVTNYGATPALTGPVNNQNFCILTKVNTSWGSSTVIFQMQFANRPTAHGLRLTMTKKVGNRVSELVDINDSTAHHNIGVKVLVDGQYYRGEGVWGTSANPYELQSWDITNIPSNGPITLQFCLAASVGTSPVELVAIGDVKLEEITELYEEYKKVNDQDYPIAGASGSDTEADVSVLFSYARENSNMVGDTVQPLPTHYDYLKTTRTRIQVPLKATLPSNCYQPMYSYWLTGWRWRLIAMAFHPRDDVYYLTLHRSVSLDDIAAQHSIVVKGDVSHNAPATVRNNDYLQVTMTGNIDYVVVMMGYEDITADTYNDDGVVSIEHVTDDVTITAITR